LDVPEPDGAGEATRNNELAVGRQGHADDPLGVPLELLEFLAVSRVPQPQRLVRAAREDALTVLREDGAADVLGMSDKFPDLTDLHVRRGRGNASLQFRPDRDLLEPLFQADAVEALDVGQGLLVPEGGALLKASLDRHLCLVGEVPPGVPYGDLCLAGLG